MVDQMRQIMIERFEKQDPSDGFYDVAFTIQNKLLHAHRFLLSTVSPTFQAMFSETWTSSTKPIEIKACPFETFKQFISYFYHGKCEFDETIIFDIIDLAEMYQVQPLKNQFNIFLSQMIFTDANIYQLLELLVVYGFKALENSLGNYLVANWRTLFEREDFLNANKNVYLGILELDRIYNEKMENALFEKLFTWSEMQARKKNANFEDLKIEDQQKFIKAEMADFVPKFNFGFRSLNFLNDFVAARNYVFDDWDEVLNKAENNKDFIDEEKIKFYLKLQILPENFNGRYHQVLRGITYSQTEEPINEFIEFIKSFPNSNGVFTFNWELHCNLEHLKDLEYFEDSQYYLGFHNTSEFVLLNSRIFKINQSLMDFYDYVCDLEGDNFPQFDEDEKYFCIQIL